MNFLSEANLASRRRPKAAGHERGLRSDFSRHDKKSMSRCTKFWKGKEGGRPKAGRHTRRGQSFKLFKLGWKKAG